MQQFTYTITDPFGIHARPAGELAKLVKPHGDTVVTITKGQDSAKATQLLKLMRLCVKHGDEITVSAEGPEEEQVLAQVQRFLQERL